MRGKRESEPLRLASIDGKTLVYDAFDRVAEEGSSLQILYGPGGKLGVMSGQTAQRVYLGLPKGAQLIYDASQTANPIAVHPDLMGNGVIGADFTGNEVFSRFFAPFGETYFNTGSGVSDFTGHYQDLDANLYDYELREQSPVQGRWLNPDPSGMAAVSLGDPQTLNRYSYVRGSAMGMTDPNGLHGEWQSALEGFLSMAFLNFTPIEWGGDGDGIQDNVAEGMDSYLDDTVVTYTLVDRYWDASSPGDFTGDITESLAAQNQGQGQASTTAPHTPRVYPQNFIGPLQPGDVRGFVADLNNPVLSPLANTNQQATQFYGESTQCVAFTKFFSGAPNSTLWELKQPVLGTDMLPGTAIATGDSTGKFPQSGHPNSGLWVSKGPVPNSFVILDQPNNLASRRLVLPRATYGIANDSRAYSVITVP